MKATYHTKMSTLNQCNFNYYSFFTVPSAIILHSLLPSSLINFYFTSTCHNLVHCQQLLIFSALLNPTTFPTRVQTKVDVLALATHISATHVQLPYYKTNIIFHHHHQHHHHQTHTFLKRLVLQLPRIHSAPGLVPYSGDPQDCPTSFRGS